MTEALARATILLTGGSRGVGAATVLALTRREATVIFTYREKAARAEEVAARAGPGRAIPAQADITAPEDLTWLGRLRGYRDITEAANVDLGASIAFGRNALGEDSRTRLFGIAAFTEPMEVLEWDPPLRLEIGHGSIVAGIGTWKLEPVDGGTRFTWRERIRLRVPVVGELAAWIYRPILLAMMDRSMRGFRGYLFAAGPARA